MMKDEGELAMKPEEMLRSVYRAWQHMQLLDGKDAPGWADAPDEDRSAWAYAYRLLFALVAEASEGETYRGIAHKVYKHWQDIKASEPEWGALTPSEKEKWAHIVRHMVNILDMDLDDDGDGAVETHEQLIAEQWQTRSQALSEAK